MQNERYSLSHTHKSHNMEKTKRMVNIRGYIREVTVSHLKVKVGNEYVCITANGLTEIVPEHLFYHRENGEGLVLRGGCEFMRKWPNHPIEIERVSA